MLKTSVRTPWTFHKCLMRNEEHKPKQSLFLVSLWRAMMGGGNVSPSIAVSSACCLFSHGSGFMQAVVELVQAPHVGALISISPYLCSQGSGTLLMA